jgi:APA family basic amino acid/polyamine antiporter
MRDEIRAHAPPGADVDGGLRRVLGPVSATCIVIGAIVGVGIFFTPSQIARIAGGGGLALGVWAAGGLVALLGALTFAELGGLYGRTAGQYQVLRDAYGPLVAFCFVLCNSTAVLGGGIAIISIVCAQNLVNSLQGTVASGLGVDVLAAGLIVALAAANVLGVRWGAAIQNITVLAKLAALLLVTALALSVAGTQPAPPPPEAAAAAGRELSWIAALFAGLVPALFAYGGWQYVLWMGGEIRAPRRNVPLATVLGVSIVVAVYLAVNWAYLHLLGAAGVAGSRALASDAVSVVWPRAGARFTAAAVAVSAFGVLAAQLLSGPRLLFGMARDGRFFAIFGRAHPRFATPWAAIAVVAGLAAALVLAVGQAGIDRLLTGVVLVDAVFFALTGAAVLVLRRRRPEADRPVRVPLYPVVPALFVLFEAAIIYGAFQVEATRSAAWIGLAWILAATLTYVLLFRRRRRAGEG